MTKTFKLAVVITTVNGPNHGSLPAWREWCTHNDAVLIVVGDKKTPDHGTQGGTVFIDVKFQDRHWPELSQLVPWNTYARKSMGYLAAADNGCTHVFDTDDDNYPLHKADQHLQPRDPVTAVLLAGRHADDPWVNTFANFTGNENHDIWPRGGQFNPPLGHLVSTPPMFDCPVRQYMCDEEPDLDAVQRLRPNTSPHLARVFRGDGFALGVDTWAPINTQSTMIDIDRCLHLCYVPWSCSHRCTDILRGWLMLRSLWSQGTSVSYHESVVRQDRNPHDYRLDLESELPMYSLYHWVPRAFNTQPATLQHNLEQCIVIGFCQPEELASWTEYQRLAQELMR